jgi:3',5'-nucleoside bisphosphate phosphatase
VIDLHLHSRFSDGSESPETIAEMARARGISTLALTDHDNTFGMARMRAACELEGVDLIPGVELSLKDPQFLVRDRNGDEKESSPHVLAYWVPEDAGSPFQQALSTLRIDRFARNDKMLASLNKLGFHRITKEKLIAEAGSEDNIGRPHFASLMMKEHPEIVGPHSLETSNQIFNDYLTPGAPAYHERNTVTVAEFLELARGSRVVFSLAHPIPVFFGRDVTLATVEREMPRIIARYRELGFTGVEAYYGGFDKPARDLMVKLTRDAGLVPTGGSDFHGKYREGAILGHGWNTDNVVPESILEELAAQR